MKLVPLESLGTVSYSPSIVTVALSSIISEIKSDIDRKSLFFHTPCISGPRYGGPHRNIAVPFVVEKTRIVFLSDGENTLRYV